MEFITRPLIVRDAELASELDKKWFGEYGVSIDQINEFISSNPNGGLALLANGNFEAFATFEILEQKLPTNYVGTMPKVRKALFSKLRTA